MKSAAPYIISLIFVSLLIVPGIGQDEVGPEKGELEQVGRNQFFEDSLNALPADTLEPAPEDSLQRETDTRGDLLDNLVKPAVLISLVGGVLYLIFTQRGR